MKITKKKYDLFDIFNYTMFIIVTVLMIYPFWNTLATSLMNANEASDLGLKLFPKEITFEAYKLALSSRLLSYAYVNTILRTLIKTALSVTLSFFAAYPLAKKQLPARTFFTIIFLIPMFFGGGLIPNYLLIKNLGMYDTFFALVFPGLLGTFNILIMRNFIMSIPHTIEESAVIDGASFLTVLLKIIIPLSMPILATVSLWVGVNTWNEWFGASIYTTSDKLTVLQVILRRAIIENDNVSMMNEVTGNESVITKSIQAATIMITIGPIILVYPFAQKYFVKGIMVGSLKG